jgi:hypothetical protein
MSNERIEDFWENATADDVARVMAGETVEARFRDFDKYDWWSHPLSGWCECSEFKWIDSNGSSWAQCQVYREPSWHANRPDPGPGWVLLGKFPDEELKPGDEAWDLWDDKQWSESENANGGGHQVFGVWYRRRIEPVEDPAGDWEPTDEEFQYAQDLCRVPKGTHDPVDFRKFVDKAKDPPIISESPTYDFPLPLRSKGIRRVPVPMRSYDPTELKGLKISQADGDFRKFVDKAKAGEVSFTCSFVWEGPRAKVGDRIQHPNGCWLEITESGFKIEAALDTIEFTG